MAALYLAADAALVSTVFDGLNLFPYEFTASQRPDDPAALVISEFMGCSRSLSGAIRVNPWSASFGLDFAYSWLFVPCSMFGFPVPCAGRLKTSATRC